MNDARSFTQPIPRAAGSKLSQNGQHQHDAREQHEREPDERVADVCRPLPVDRSQVAIASTSRPAATGYDHELIAYSAPIASAGDERLGDAAPDGVAARPGERDLQRERRARAA